MTTSSITSSELGSCLRRIGLYAAAAGVVGGAVCFFGHARMPEEFYPAYLTAYMYWLGISLGCLGLAMMHGLSGGAGGGLSVASLRPAIRRCR